MSGSWSSPRTFTGSRQKWSSRLISSEVNNLIWFCACHILLYLVICHGDLWWSNILFKYRPQNQLEEDKLPVEVKFIGERQFSISVGLWGFCSDFQSARLASLITDILSFTFTSVTSQVRKESIFNLLEVTQSFPVISEITTHITYYITHITALPCNIRPQRTLSAIRWIHFYTRRIKRRISRTHFVWFLGRWL